MNVTIADVQRVIDHVEHVTHGRFRSFKMTAALADPIRGREFSRVDDAMAYYLGVLSVQGHDEIRKGPFSEWYDRLSDYHFSGQFQDGITTALKWYNPGREARLTHEP